MLRTTILFVFVIAFYTNIVAQFYTGGCMTINYVNGIYADIAPVAGYQIKNFRIGTSPFISYNKPNNSKAIYSYGDRIFTQYDLFKGAILHAEIEAANVPVGYVGEQEVREWVFALPVGGGYQQSFGKIAVQGLILYDLLLDPNSPNENPIIRGGVNYKF